MCTNPLIAYEDKQKKLNGKKDILFTKVKGQPDILLPCGKCIECKMEYSRQWAVRCHCEAQMHEANSMLTLTFNQENHPQDNSVHPEVISKFIKRLRKAIYPKKIKFFGTGEYGEKGWKPHYHILIFGYDFPDKVLWGQSPKGMDLYISEQLSKLWPYGYHSIGQVTVESSAYVARYCIKKLELETDEDGRIPLTDPETGEYHLLEKEFITMSKGSKKHGTYPIAYEWIKKYWKDVYPKDYYVIDGTKHKPPRYFDTWMKENQPDIIEEVLTKRMEFARINQHEQNPYRTHSRNKVAKAMINQHTRQLED